MQHIQGISRHQLQMSSLEDKISADNPELQLKNKPPLKCFKRG